MSEKEISLKKRINKIDKETTDYNIYLGNEKEDYGTTMNNRKIKRERKRRRLKTKT